MLPAANSKYALRQRRLVSVLRLIHQPHSDSIHRPQFQMADTKKFETPGLPEKDKVVFVIDNYEFPYLESKERVTGTSAK